MELKAASSLDFPEIVALTNLAFRGGVGWTVESKYIAGERISQKTLEENLVAHPTALLLIDRDETDRRLRGSVWLEPRLDDVWYMGLLAVPPEMQGQQFGRKMVEAVEHFVRQRGGRRIRISVVNVRQRLIAWYERRGYRRTGELEPFPYGDERVGQPLRDDLEFVIMEKAL